MSAPALAAEGPETPPVRTSARAGRLSTLPGWTDAPDVLATHRLDRSGFDPGGTPRAVVRARSAD